MGRQERSVQAAASISRFRLTRHTLDSLLIDLLFEGHEKERRQHTAQDSRQKHGGYPLSGNSTVKLRLSGSPVASGYIRTAPGETSACGRHEMKGERDHDEEGTSSAAVCKKGAVSCATSKDHLQATGGLRGGLAVQK